MNLLPYLLTDKAVFSFTFLFLILEERSVIKNKSMGMKITEERLRLLSDKSWNKLIHIIDLKDSMDKALGTRVEISIPSNAYD